MSPSAQRERLRYCSPSGADRRSVKRCWSASGPCDGRSLARRTNRPIDRGMENFLFVASTSRTTARWSSSSAPDFVGRLDHEAQFGDLLVETETIAFHRRRKPALRRKAKLIERHVLTGFFDTSLEPVLRLEETPLGGDEPENDHLALGHEAQWLEASGTLVIVFEEEPVDVQLTEEGLGHEVVAALGRPVGLEVTSARVCGDRHALWS